MRIWVLSVAAAVVATACVDKGPSKKKIDPAYIEQNLLTEEPANIPNRVDADLGGKVVYLGNELVEGETLKPGGKVKIIHYWKVVSPPGDGWGVFAHVEGETKADWMNVDYTDMRAGYPPDKWKKGDIIRDEQSFALSKEWKSPQARLAVGLYQRGKQGVGARMPVVSGPKGKDNTVIAYELEVGGTGATATETPKKPEEHVIAKAEKPLTIDGVADEEAWTKAAWSPAFTSAEGGPALDKATKARLLYDDQYLYAFVEVEDDDVHSPYHKHDEDLWKADVVELFIDADRNRRGYVELQVNPNNTTLDIFFPGAPRKDGDRLWNAEMKTAVKVDGTADDRGDTDKGWSAEIAIPLAAVKGRIDDMKVAIPPELGDRWRLNVVRVEKTKNGQTLASAWNPITYKDFHGLSRMLTVRFGDAEGKVPEASEEATPDEEKAGGDEAGGDNAEGAAAQKKKGAAVAPVKKPGPGAGQPAKAATLRARPVAPKKAAAKAAEKAPAKAAEKAPE